MDGSIFLRLLNLAPPEEEKVEEKVLVGLSVAAIAGVRSKVAYCEHPQKCRG